MAKINTQEFYQKLDQFYKNKQIQEAEKYMLTVLKEAGSMNDIEGIVAVCNELGGLYRASHRVEEALWNYEKVMNGLNELGMQETPNYAAALINYSDVYMVDGNYQKAYDLAMQALNLLDRIHGDTYQYAASYNNISAMLRGLGRMDDAERAARKAIDLISTMPERVIDLATSYINLGQIQMAAGKNEEARQSLVHAQQLFWNYNQDRDTHYAIVIQAIGNLDYLEGKYREAADEFRQSAELIKRDFGTNADYQTVMESMKRAESMIK